MKILVPTKRVPDTDHRVQVNDAGTDIVDAGIPFMLNPFDAIALEEALRIRETVCPDAQIVAMGIGSNAYEPELRTALAMGADRAVLIQCSESLDPWNVARILASAARNEAIDLVLMGKQAVDDDANQTGQFLAALLGWPQATFASKLEFSTDRLRVSRETDQGIEVVTVSLPAVVTADLRLNEPRYASLPSILKAKKKPIEHVAFESLGLTIEPRVRVITMKAVSSQRSCIRVNQPSELIAKLREQRAI